MTCASWIHFIAVTKSQAPTRRVACWGKVCIHPNKNLYGGVCGPRVEASALLRWAQLFGKRRVEHTHMWSASGERRGGVWEPPPARVHRKHLWGGACAHVGRRLH